MSNNIKVGFSATDAGYTSTVKKINESTKSIDNTVKKVSGNVSNSFGSMIKAGAGLAVGFGAIKAAGELVSKVFDGFSDALDLGGKLKDLSDRTGETSGNLMLLQRAFDNAGSSADAVGPALNKLQKFMVDAANGSEKNTNALANLGLTMTDLKGKAPIEQMQILADRIKAIPDPAERSAAAMSIFGKSGGALLPVLMNLTGELKTAENQLGSMPGVMTRMNEVFDNIGDNITVIKGKFMEFAAGLLEKIAPALEFITTVMTQFDAAAFGEKVGQALIGAGQGMQAFKSAMDALALGEFKLAMEIAFGAMRLAAFESFNSIVKHAQASFSAVAEFLKAVLGPGSGLYTIITGTFETLGMKFSRSVGEGLKTILEVIPGWGSIMAARIAESIDVLDVRIANKSSQMKNALAQVPDDLIYGFGEAGKAFDKTLAGSKDLINTHEMDFELMLKIAELEKKRAASIKEQGLATEINDSKRKANQEAYKNTLKIINQIEAEIDAAKLFADKEEVAALKKKLAFEKAIAEALKQGMTLQEAITYATNKQNSALESVVNSNKKITKEMQKQAGLAGQMAADIAKMKHDEKIDPGGRRQQEFQKALNEGNSAKANRIQREIAGRERNKEINDMFKEFKGNINAPNKNVKDMAKELGIDTFRKTVKQLQDEIESELRKRKGKDKPGEEGKKEPGGGKGPENRPDPNTGIIQSILNAVNNIDKKLPQTALGY